MECWDRGIIWICRHVTGQCLAVSLFTLFVFDLNQTYSAYAINYIYYITCYVIYCIWFFFYRANGHNWDTRAVFFHQPSFLHLAIPGKKVHIWPPGFRCTDSWSSGNGSGGDVFFFPGMPRQFSRMPRQQDVFFLATSVIWVVVSKIFYFHPYLGKISNLTNIFQLGWNLQLGNESAMNLHLRKVTAGYPTLNRTKGNFLQNWQFLVSTVHARNPAKYLGCKIPC